MKAKFLFVPQGRSDGISNADVNQIRNLEKRHEAFIEPLAVKSVNELSKVSQRFKPWVSWLAKAGHFTQNPAGAF